MRELAQVRERRVELELRFGDDSVGCGAGPGWRLGELQREAEAEQTLLRAVVEVALQSPAFPVADLDDACARGAQLRELRADRRAKALVLDGESQRVGQLV
jgi:hypothetical protein